MKLEGDGGHRADNASLGHADELGEVETDEGKGRGSESKQGGRGRLRPAHQDRHVRQERICRRFRRTPKGRRKVFPRKVESIDLVGSNAWLTHLRFDTLIALK